MSMRIGHVRSKTRSLDQILEKPCVRTIGNIFSPIIMKLGQKVCLDKISDEFEKGSCWVKNKVTISNLRKNLCTLWRPDFWPQMSDQKLGQVLETPCVCSRGHIFSPIIMKLSESVCL